HLLSTDLSTLDLKLPEDQLEALEGRSMIVRKAQVIPFECVVRGALAGSGWKEYRASQTICGHSLLPDLRESDRIDPIFTPATKAVTGHDENVPVSRLETDLGIDLTRRLEALSLEIYSQAADYARSRGLILADTKFEFGTDPKTGELLLIDEVLTPDSSRYWAIDGYEPGRSQPSFDKQFVRDWLETTGWDKASPPPSLPADVVEKTRSKYLEAYQRLTGLEFPWT
ncbi:MAG TPA: phosphoribosylaminoimidazolesuccinocarboxamide synthase, partial [Isosphaeraceae bacterium]|nr:phosphoribosylaminoimidazolesuccinocarboxamide synthase [Isosphaeraceae bacterium]